MVSKPLAALLILIIAIATIIAVWLYMTNQGPPNLSFALATNAGMAGKDTVIDLNVENTGYELSGVAVTISSNAFGQVTSEPTNIKANTTAQVTFNVKINDIENGNYPVTISYSQNGQTAQATEFPPFHVLPSVEIVDQHWPRNTLDPAGFFEKSHIGQNDRTSFYFKVKNNLSSTYRGLTASVTMTPTADGLKVSPSSLSIVTVGPQGKVGEYTFDFATHNTPPGTYTLTIYIFSEGIVAFSGTYTLWVDS